MLTKMCTNCGIEKTIEYFSKSNMGKYHVRSTCKSCNKDYKYKNRNNINVYNSSRKALTSIYNKEYRQINKERLALHYEKTKKAKGIYLKAYAQLNKDKSNERTAQRKALKLQSSPLWRDNEAIVGMYRLAIIFNKVGINLHVDHIVPLQSKLVCGLHCEANLQLLSAHDNLSKGNKHWPNMW